MYKLLTISAPMPHPTVPYSRCTAPMAIGYSRRGYLGDSEFGDSTLYTPIFSYE